jgi:putative multiple sugar transport system ATP-binding protein
MTLAQAPAEAATPVRLEMRGIVKDFPGVRALDGVDLELSGGEVLALVGENGAGKSTLINILGGRWPAGSFDGHIVIDGQPAAFSSPNAALEAGIAVIHQELQLVPDLSVAENLFLGRLPTRRGIVNRRALVGQAREMLGRYGFDIDPAVPIRRLSVGRRQLVEIARALDRRARILVLDEPSSALTEVETDRLLAILRDLRTAGVATIYISHKLDEVFAIADRVTVLRDGRTVATLRRAEATPGSVVRLMVGRDLGELYRHSTTEPGPVRLEVRDLVVPGSSSRLARLVEGVSFEVRGGEVVALAGLLGSGRTETLLGIFGALSRDGTISIDGTPLPPSRIDSAIAAGVALVTEDRKQTGLVLEFSCQTNIAIANLDRLSRGGLVDRRRERELAQRYARELQLRPPRVDRPAKAFSGGNQQKIVLAKWLARRPTVLLLDEPTRGVDVGAKAEIFAIIDDLRKAGTAILMVSSDLLEVLGVADRILVMHEGVLEGELSGRTATQEAIMTLATRAAEPAVVEPDVGLSRADE